MRNLCVMGAMLLAATGCGKEGPIRGTDVQAPGTRGSIVVTHEGPAESIGVAVNPPDSSGRTLLSTPDTLFGQVGQTYVLTFPDSAGRWRWYESESDGRIVEDRTVSVVATQDPVGVLGRFALPVSASFSVDRACGAVPLSVDFTNTSSGSITNVAWRFGSETSTEWSPVYQFQDVGDSEVLLEVVGPLGRDVASRTINVLPSLSTPVVRSFAVGANGEGEWSIEWSEVDGATGYRIEVLHWDSGPSAGSCVDAAYKVIMSRNVPADCGGGLSDCVEIFEVTECLDPLTGGGTQFGTCAVVKMKVRAVNDQFLDCDGGLLTSNWGIGRIERLEKCQ